MENSNLPLNKELINLIEKNSDSLAKDFKQYLKDNNKFFEFGPNESYPFTTLKNILEEQFETFNTNGLYTIEIESGKFSEQNKKDYYDNLFNFTVPKAVRCP